MSFVAVAVGGSAVAGLAGSAIQAHAAGKAADKQAAAADRSNQIQKQMFEEQRSDQEPWRRAGAAALSGMGNPDFQKDFSMADFQADPGYAFRMSEGQKALERSASARGGLNSGGFAKALTRYGQDYASNEYQNAYNRFNADRDRRFNRYASVAGLGQTANSQIGAAGQNYANQFGQNSIGAANAAGAAGIASANAYGSALSGLGKLGMDAYSMGQQNNWMQQQLMAQQTNALLNAPEGQEIDLNMYGG